MHSNTLLLWKPGKSYQNIDRNKYLLSRISVGKTWPEKYAINTFPEAAFSFDLMTRNRQQHISPVEKWRSWQLCVHIDNLEIQEIAQETKCINETSKENIKANKYYTTLETENILALIYDVKLTQTANSSINHNTACQNSIRIFCVWNKARWNTPL